MRSNVAARVAALLTPFVLLGTGVALAGPAHAHGYVNGPYSRAAACRLGLNADCGTVVYEPQSLEAPKGFPASGPADGRIASAGGVFPALDQQSYGRWYKNPISTGTLTIDWRYTAPHRTAKWSYYMTKQSWDPNAPLKRADLELIATVAHDGTAANSRPAHSINVPANRSGYHVILAIWEVADTANAFYNVIDVNVGPATGEGAVPTIPAEGSTTDAQAPTTPTGLHAMGSTETSVDLMWSGSTDNVAVDGYTVLRNGLPIAQTKSTSYLDPGLVAGSSYTYQVLATDAAGNSSPRSAMLTVSTKSAAPSAGADTGSGAGSSAAWSATGRYAVGDLVTYGGSTYRCIQAYQGYGDPNWILAPSLWQRTGA